MVIDELGPLELRVIAAAFLYRWRIAAYFVVGALLAGGIVWVLPRAWVSVASFIPETSNSSQVSGIAADLGIGTGASVGESPDFYVELLRSDDVLRSIARNPVTFGSGSVPLWRALEIDAPDSALRDFKTLKKLRKMMLLSANRRTSVVRIEVTGPTAQVATQVAQAAVAAVNDFNVKIRRLRASSERSFTDERLALSRQELREREDSLRSFLDRNREYRQSPTLVLAYDQLVREITLRQSIVTALAQTFEQSRIDEVRNTPMISVVQSPSSPVLPQTRLLVAKVTAGGLAGLLLGLLVALRSVIWRRPRLAPAALKERLRAELRSAGWSEA